MDLRLALYELAAAHRLDAAAGRRLEALAGLQGEPPALRRRLPLAVGVLAAALAGLGVVFWVAANWQALGRGGRFALLQLLLLGAGLGALRLPAARAPLALLALLGSGALLAYFGQTYQTGADAWTLFALWAALTLPLAAAVRSDLLWAPWVLVAMTALALAVQTFGGHRWRFDAEVLPVHLAGWAGACALAAALGAPLRRYTGAGPWALRSALTLAVVSISATALGGLFADRVAPQYPLALLLLAGLGLWLARPASFEVFGLAAVALGLDTLLVAGLARALFKGSVSNPVGNLFLLGLAAAALLSASVTLVLRLARRADGGGAAAAAGGGRS